MAACVRAACPDDTKAPRRFRRSASVEGAVKDVAPCSALRVLGRLPRALQAVLLALLGPRVAGQQPSLAQRGACVGMGAEEGTGDAVPDRSGLAGDAAAGDEDAGRVAALGLGHPEGQEDGAV